MEKINWGILGLGQIAQKFSEGFSETSNAKLLAIASKDIDKLKKDLFNFRVQKINGQIKSPSKISETKRNIARLKTLIVRKDA